MTDDERDTVAILIAFAQGATIETLCRAWNQPRPAIEALLRGQIAMSLSTPLSITPRTDGEDG
jgi:hypothetical protein